MASHNAPSGRSSAANSQRRPDDNLSSGPRSKTMHAQSWTGFDPMRQNTSGNLSERNHPQAPRAEASSRAASTVPSVPSWLYKLPSSISEYSAVDPPALGNLDAKSDRQSTVDPRLAPPRSAQSSRPAQPLRPAQVLRPNQPMRSPQSLRNTEAIRVAAPTTVVRDMPRGPTGSTRGSEAQSFDWRDAQTSHEGQSLSRHSISQKQPMDWEQEKSLSGHPTKLEKPTSSNRGQSFSREAMIQPQFEVRDPTPVVNNFHYNYSPVDSRQNITTNNQRYHVDSGFHQTINAPTQNHTYNNQHHNVSNSRQDTITQSIDTTQIGHVPASNSQRECEPGSAPSEAIPLRRTRIKCQRGLFIGKTISTHQHVVDDRPC